MSEHRGWWRRRRERSRAARLVEWGALLLVAVVVAVTAAPQLLAWPHKAEFGSTTVYSTEPIPAGMRAVLARADGLLAKSPLNAPIERSIFLTDGGWRWNLLALTSRGAFALRRPWRDAVIVTRSDVASDRIDRGSVIAGSRSLSGTLAHELTHILVARHYGEIRAARLPTWKSEGYADHVAQESSLSPADYRRLQASGTDHPARVYFEGRRRVAAILSRNAGNPDSLFLAD